MRSITISSSFNPLNSYPKRTQNPKNEPRCLGFIHRQEIPPLLSFRTKAISSPAITETVSPGGDVTVLIETGVVLFVMYIITNWVVPYFVAKEFDEEKPKEEDTPS